MTDRVGIAAEIHQRQVGPELHVAPLGEHLDHGARSPSRSPHSDGSTGTSSRQPPAARGSRPLVARLGGRSRLLSLWFRNNPRAGSSSPAQVQSGEDQISVACHASLQVGEVTLEAVDRDEGDLPDRRARRTAGHGLRLVGDGRRSCRRRRSGIGRAGRANECVTEVTEVDAQADNRDGCDGEKDGLELLHGMTPGCRSPYRCASKGCSMPPRMSWGSVPRFSGLDVAPAMVRGRAPPPVTPSKGSLHDVR